SANPTPAGSNVVLTATLTAVAPGAGTPSGTVQFTVDGSAFGSSATLSGGIANLGTALLTHGYHTVAAAYNGDGNFFGSTNSLASGLLVNATPVAGGYSISTTK